MPNQKPKYSDFFNLTPEQAKAMTPNERRAARKEAKRKYDIALAAWKGKNRLNKQEGKVKRGVDEFNRKLGKNINRLQKEATKDMRKQRAREERKKEKIEHDKKVALAKEKARKEREAREKARQVRDQASNNYRDRYKASRRV